MSDSVFDSYSQPFYFGDFIQDITRRTSTMSMGPLQHIANHERTQFSNMAQSYPVDPCGQSLFNPASLAPQAPLNIATPAPYEEQGDLYQGGLLPSSLNPPTSLPPSAFLPPSPCLDNAAHSPTWPTDGVATIACQPYKQPIPVQLPELGFDDGASPLSNETAYTRMALSESPLPIAEQQDTDSPAHHTDSTEEDSENPDPCYAELLRKCLLNAPEHTMSLRDLYAWVAEHSPKAKDPASTGWKNSVRHNLSMNQGFEKVPDKNSPTSDKGKRTRSYWRLTEDAANCGIQSTTRYRKGDGKRRSQRSNRNATPDDKRVKSGAKGGQATRRLANRRAAAAARSTWSSSRLKSHLNELYFNSNHTSPSLAASSSPISACQEVPISSHWTNIPNIHDPAPYALPTAFCKFENEMQGCYTPVVPDYYQYPISWAHSVSPQLPIKAEGEWFGGTQ